MPYGAAVGLGRDVDGAARASDDAEFGRIGEGQGLGGVQPRGGGGQAP